MPHARNLTGREIAIKVEQMRLQILQRLALREIIRELIQMAEPGVSILPVGESERCHGRHAIAQAAETQGRVVTFGHRGAGSVGAQISSMLMEKAFDDLDAPVLRITSLDAPAIYTARRSNPNNSRARPMSWQRC